MNCVCVCACTCVCTKKKESTCPALTRDSRKWVLRDVGPGHLTTNLFSFYPQAFILFFLSALYLFNVYLHLGQMYR